jgi:hypothetical protein
MDRLFLKVKNRLFILKKRTFDPWKKTHPLVNHPRVGASAQARTSLQKDLAANDQPSDSTPLYAHEPAQCAS